MNGEFCKGKKFHHSRLICDKVFLTRAEKLRKSRTVVQVDLHDYFSN